MKPVAFVFPGQGSQSVGMLDAWGSHPVLVQTLQEASQSLGQDLGQLIHSGTKEELSLTVNTQPVMLLAGVLAHRMWVDAGGPRPVAVAGHSLGEFSALVVAGVMSLQDALPLVRFRAQAMQNAVPVGVGAMAAILGLPSAAVVQACAQAQADLSDTHEVVDAANFNDPLQTVISGSLAAVTKACDMLKALGAKRTLMLPVSAPFHSRLMQPAAEKLREKLAAVNLKAPHTPLVNNIDVKVQMNPEDIRDALYRQAFGPVRWVECTNSLLKLGAQALLECGPGKALTGMGKRIAPEVLTLSVYDPESLSISLEALQ